MSIRGPRKIAMFFTRKDLRTLLQVIFNCQTNNRNERKHCISCKFRPRCKYLRKRIRKKYSQLCKEVKKK